MTLDRRTVSRAVLRHAPPGFAPTYTEMEWRALENDGLDTMAYVVTADIRQSTTLMKESLDPTGYARAVDEFVRRGRETAHHTNGWFDKFTGDGFIAYWPYRQGEAWGVPASDSLEFVARTMEQFPETFERLRRNVQNLPSGSGLSVGLDAGPLRQVWIGDDLTVVGAPVVGAIRMVSVARAGEAIANVFPGEFFARAPETWKGGSLEVARVQRATKDFRGGQEEYILRFRRSAPAAGASGARYETDSSPTEHEDD